MRNTILVSEVFGPVIQGEGALIGKPTVFVRTGGCDMRCVWCDTLYAVLPEFRHEWQPMTAKAILERVLQLSQGKPILVTLSGGNPALQPLEPLLDLGHEAGLRFALETQGSIARPWFSKLDHLVLSPKPPSSQMQIDWEKLKDCVDAAGADTDAVLKVVVFDEDDYRFAREAAARFPNLPIYLQAGNHTPSQEANNWAAQPDLMGIADRLSWILQRVTADGWNDVTVLPQLHTILWGNRRGV